MGGWIWHQRFYVEDAVYVGSYYNITHTPEQKPLFESKPIFISELNGVFKRGESNAIGFNTGK